jgi:hypothetical protein
MLVKEGAAVLDRLLHDSEIVLIEKDSRPLLEGFVGGEHDRAALLALADNLEKEVGAALIDGKIADLVKEENGRSEIFAQFGLPQKKWTWRAQRD